MARIQIKSVAGEPIAVVIDGHDITHAVGAHPWPVVQVAPAGNVGDSRVAITLVGEVEIDIDGTIHSVAEPAW